MPAAHSWQWPSSWSLWICLPPPPHARTNRKSTLRPGTLTVEDGEGGRRQGSDFSQTSCAAFQFRIGSTQCSWWNTGDKETLLYSTQLYSTLLRSTLLRSTLLHSALLRFTLIYSTPLPGNWCCFSHRASNDGKGIYSLMNYWRHKESQIPRFQWWDQDLLNSALQKPDSFGWLVRESSQHQ